MGAPTTSKHMLIALGNGEDPEVFSFPCGANAQTVKFTNSTGEEVLLDCTDPVNAPAAISRWVESQDTELSIAGRVSTEAFDEWRKWADDASTKNIRVELMTGVSGTGGHYTVPSILQDFEMGKEGSSTITFSATIVGAGPRVWTPAS